MRLPETKKEKMTQRARTVCKIFHAMPRIQNTSKLTDGQISFSAGTQKSWPFATRQIWDENHLFAILPNSLASFPLRRLGNVHPGHSTVRVHIGHRSEVGQIVGHKPSVHSVVRNLIRVLNAVCKFQTLQCMPFSRHIFQEPLLISNSHEVTTFQEDFAQ